MLRRVEQPKKSTPVDDLSVSPLMNASSIGWTARLLIQCGQRPELPPFRFNPHPPGVIWPGSATQAVLNFLGARRGEYFSRAAIIKATGRSDKAVDSALLFLRRRQLAIAVIDAARHPRYQRYTAAERKAD